MSHHDFTNARWDLWHHWGELHDNGFDLDHLKGVLLNIRRYARSVNHYLDLNPPDKFVVLFELRTILDLLNSKKNDRGLDFSRDRTELDRALQRLAPSLMTRFRREVARLWTR